MCTLSCGGVWSGSGSWYADLLSARSLTWILTAIVFGGRGNLAHDGMLQYDGVVYTRRVPDAPRYSLADCKFVLHVCC
jgi:hypothetical protein